MSSGKYHTGGRVDPASYQAFVDAINRRVAESMGVTEDMIREKPDMGLKPDPIGQTADEQKFRYAASKTKMREVNPQDRWKPEADRIRENEVTIWNAPEEYPVPHYVHLGRFGRIGDIRLYGPDGRPVNIGPTPDSRTMEWSSINDAMKHFKRVQEAFLKLNAGQLR